MSVAESLLLHESFVRRLARSLAGGDGDDLAQEAWSAALQGHPGDVQDAAGWLATIVKNLWRNRRRGELRRTARERAVGSLDSAPSVAAILELEEARRHVVAAVVALPERLRAVVLCRYYEDLDSTAIGERLGMPASTVRSRLREAHALLRARLDAQHGSRGAWAVPFAGWCAPSRGAIGGTVLRTAWSVRIAASAVAVLLVSWLVTMSWQPAVDLPPVTLTEPATTAALEEPARASDEPGAERQIVAVVTPPSLGPEDLPGRVVDAVSELPIAGAEVELEHRDADEFTNLDLEHTKRVDRVGSTRSDADGRFAFRVQRAWQHRLTVRAAGFATETLPRCTGGCEVVVRLSLPASIAGVVRNTDGVPLGDVLVEAIERRGPGDRPSTRTADDGTFVLTGLVPRPSYVTARRHGIQPSRWELLELAPGAQQHVEIVVADGRSVRGVVCDAATKQGIGGARIAGDWTMRDAALSAADGTFEVRGLEDRARLHVLADGYAPRIVVLRGNPDVTPIEIEMSPGSMVIGRVVDGSGQPVPGSYVAAAAQIFHASGGIDTEWRTAEVAVDGTFRVAGLPVDAIRSDGVYQQFTWQLLARAPRFGARVLCLPHEGVKQGVVNVGDVVLVPEAILEGRLIEMDGTPIADAEVDLTCTPRGFDSLVPAEHGGTPLHHFARREARTAADGMFRVAGLTAGSYRVSARLGDDDLDLPNAVREVVDGEVAAMGDLVVDRGATIEGIVRLPPQRELQTGEQIVVTASAETGGTRSATASRDGSFRIEGVAPGSYTLHAMDVPAGLTFVPRENVAAGAKGVEIVLVPTVALDGTIVDEGGQPVPRASVCFFIEGTATARTSFADAEGRFRLEVPPGVRGKVSSIHPEFAFQQGQLPDVVGPCSDLVLRLRPFR